MIQLAVMILVCSCSVILYFLDLYIGIILASFSRSGTVPVSSDLLNMFVNGMQIVFFISFSVADVILSCPELFLRFKESMQVIIS